jgi:hypothetical protein
MKRREFITLLSGAAVGALFSLSGSMDGAVANAAEIKLFSGRGFSPVLDALIGDFERSSGHKSQSATARAIR